MVEPQTERESLDERRRLVRDAFSILDETESSVGEARVAAITQRCRGNTALLNECLSLLRHEQADDPLPALNGSGSNSRRVAPTGFHTEPGRTGPDLTAGCVIGAWTLVSFVGRGATGEVWLARRDGNVDSAMKAIRVVGLDERTLRCWESEIDALARCDHPSVVKVRDSGRATIDGADWLYIALDFIEGEPVTRAADAANLGWKQRVQLLTSVCDAVAHAHQRGVIHRDLKPANVLVGSDLMPRVIDFGVARLARSDGAAPTTAAGLLLGTLPYAAPEQLGGDGGDTRTDVHALGVMGYELLAGRTPVDVAGLDVVSALRTCADAVPMRLRTLRPEIPRSLDAVIHKAMSRNRELRYASASELADDLRRALAGRPTIARPMGLAEWARELWRQRPHLASTIATGAALLIVAGIGAHLLLARAHRAEIEAERERGERRGLMLERAVRIIQRIGSNGATAQDADELAEIDQGLAEFAEGYGKHGSDAPSLQRDSHAVCLRAQIRAALADEAFGRRDNARCVALRELVRADLSHVLASEPDNSEIRMELSIATVKLADALRETGVPAALARSGLLYIEAITMDEAIFKEKPRDRHAIDNLLRSYVRASHHAHFVGDAASALRWAERSLAQHEVLAAIAPGDPMTVHANFDARHAMACALEANGRLAEAVAHERIALETATIYWKLAPGTAHAQTSLMNSLATLHRLADGTLSDGEADILLAVADDLWLGSRVRPEDARLWRDAGFARIVAVDALLTLGRRDEAARLLARVAEQAAPKAGQSVLMLRTLASSAIDLTHPDVRGSAGALESAARAIADLARIAQVEHGTGATGSRQPEKLGSLHHEAWILHAYVAGCLHFVRSGDPASCDAALVILGNPDSLVTDPPGLALAAAAYLHLECGRREQADEAVRCYHLMHPEHEQFEWLQIRQRW